MTKPWVYPLLYGALNIASASGIVFANKMVFQVYQFKFTCALTWVHTFFTLLGMHAFLAWGMFEKKQLPPMKVLPLAGAFVAYIVLCNLSLNLNPISFYQVMKIAVAPTVLFLEFVVYNKRPTPKVVASVLVVCAGVGVATVTDPQMAQNMTGMMVGVAATLVTATFQIWVGTKQRELKASSMQLLHQYTPQATLMLTALVPLMEPVGWGGRGPAGGDGGAQADTKFGDGTLLGYHYTTAAILAIMFSAVLGLLVSLSTFLVIGATSSLTYNVVGHLKTVIILTGGCLLFGDTMPPKKLLGVSIAMCGIVWYTQLQLKSNELITRPSEVGAAASEGGKDAAGGKASRSGDEGEQPEGKDGLGEPLLQIQVSAHGASSGGAGALRGGGVVGSGGDLRSAVHDTSSPLRGRSRGS